MPKKPRQSFVPIDDIVLSGENMREDVGELTELAESIERYGILQPLLCADTVDGLVLVCGHRRLAAARRARLTEVPVIIRKLDDDERLALMVIENVHRKHLTPLEEARAVKRLLDLAPNQYVVAEQLDKSQTWVSTRLALLDLPEDVQRQVHVGDLSIWVAVGATRKKYRPREREGSQGQLPPDQKWQVHYIDKIIRWLEAGSIPWEVEDLSGRLQLLLRVLSSFVAKGQLDKPILMCEECGTVAGYIGRCCEDHDRVLCSDCVDRTHVEGAA